jgi:hypothetical protein
MKADTNTETAEVGFSLSDLAPRILNPVSAAL